MGAWPGPGNKALNPGFAWPGHWTMDPQSSWISGNYHLMSQGGRWDTDSLSWVSDAQTSPCIDAGNPADIPMHEPLPHGRRLNMGVYGGTAQASRSSVSALAHWRFDETSGSTAMDSAGNNNGGVHGAVWTEGKIGGGLQFDGVDDYVDCGNRTTLAPDQLTLAMWLFPQASFASRSVLQKGGAEAEDYRFELFGAQHPTFSFGAGLDRLVLYSNSVLKPNEWVHVTLVRDRAQARLYINGAQVLSKAYGFSPPVTEHPLVIGGSDSSHYQGKIDDLRIYGFPLADQEIGHLISEAE
jgi:hypothetical protein